MTILNVLKRLLTGNTANKKLNFKFALVFFLSLTSGCEQTPETTEKLMAAPPPNWNLIYQINSFESRISDYVPSNEENDNWVSRISFESFRNFGEADPIDVTLGEIEIDNGSCNFVQHFNLYSGFENNYPVSLRLSMCGRHSISDRGEVKMIKAIRGDDYFYVIRLVKRLDPFEVNEPEMSKSEIAAWSSYMKKIIVCNTAKSRHPCPGTEATGESDDI